jgi:DNA-binding transcriptional regulator YiaG
MTQRNKPLDFAKVETLRRHMLMTSTDMAQALRTSRMTYYKWVQGRAAPRAVNDAIVREQLRKLLVIMEKHGWPSSEVLVMLPSERTAKLLALLAADD